MCSGRHQLSDSKQPLSFRVSTVPTGKYTGGMLYLDLDASVLHGCSLFHGKVEFAFSAADLCQSDDDNGFLLPDHSPEVVDCLFQGSLCANEFLWMSIAVHVVGVNIVSRRLGENHTWRIEAFYVSPAVQSHVGFTFRGRLLFVQRLHSPVFFQNCPENRTEYSGFEKATRRAELT